jgi:hypothetical protein
MIIIKNIKNNNTFNNLRKLRSEIFGKINKDANPIIAERVINNIDEFIDCISVYRTLGIIDIVSKKNTIKSFWLKTINLFRYKHINPNTKQKKNKYFNP